MKIADPNKSGNVAFSTFMTVVNQNDVKFNLLRDEMHRVFSLFTNKKRATMSLSYEEVRQSLTEVSVKNSKQMIE